MRTFFALLAAAIGFVLVWAVAGPAGGAIANAIYRAARA